MDDFEEFQNYDEFQLCQLQTPSQLPVKALSATFCIPHFDNVNDYVSNDSVDVLDIMM